MAIDTYPPQNVSAQTPLLGHAEVTANQLGTTALTDLAGLSVNVTVPAGRRLKITGKTLAQSSVATDRIRLYIRDSANNSLAQSTVVPSIASLSVDLGVSVVLSPAAGTQTYKLSMERAGGSGTIDLIANAFAPAYILVEDITGSQLPVLPQSVPVGLLGRAEWLSNQAIVATAHAVLPLSVNVAVPAGRVLRISGRTYVSNTTASARSGLYVYEDGAQKHGGFVQRAFDGNTTVEVEAILSPSAGAHTYELKGAATVGTSTFAGDAVHPAFLTVEDVTPTPAPGQGAPGSTLGYAEVTANQGTFTAETDLTGLAVTVTVPAGRRLRITGKCQISSSVADGAVRCSIFEGATLLNFDQVVGQNNSMTLNPVAIVTPSAGSHTYKLSGLRTAGTGSLTMGANAVFPAFISVEDITGAVWPVGSTVTAGMVASEPWTDYTPVLTQGVTVGFTIDYARYQKIGRTVHCSGRVAVTGTGTAGQPVNISLPFAPAGASREIGVGVIYDSSANLGYKAVVSNTGPDRIQFWGASDTSPTVLGVNAFTAALASADQVRFSVTYEAAS